MYEKILGRMQRVLVLTRYSSKTARDISRSLDLDVADTRRLLRSMVKSDLIQEGIPTIAAHNKSSRLVQTYVAVTELIDLRK